MQPHDPVRLLDHQGELGGLDRGDHPPGRVPPDLRVVVEAGRGPADLVAVLDQRLAPLQRHHLGELAAARLEAVRHLVQELAPVHGGRRRPLARALARGCDRGVELLGARRADGGDRLLAERVLDLDRVAVAGDLLAVDEKAGLHSRDPTASPSGAFDTGQGGVGRPGGEGNRPPYPPACAEAQTPGEDEAFMWAGAGVGGLRTPARCLDSNYGYPANPPVKHSPAATITWFARSRRG